MGYVSFFAPPAAILNLLTSTEHLNSVFRRKSLGDLKTFTTGLGAFLGLLLPFLAHEVRM